MHAPVRLVLQHLAGAPPATLEIMHDNPLWADAKPRLSIAISAGRRDASRLVAALASTPRALAIEIIVDNWAAPGEAALMRATDAADHALAPVRVVTSLEKPGQSGSAPRAITHARAPWILVLDGNLAPDSRRFVEAYLDAIALANAPAVIVGGYSLKQASDDPRSALHRWHARTSECLDAAQRSTAPGHHVLTGNMAVHADVLAACPFDADRDDWGPAVATRFPIIHIDNTATRLGFDDDKTFMSRYAAIWRQSRSTGPASREGRHIHGLPFRPLLAAATGRIAGLHGLPVALRGRALNAWRSMLRPGGV
ncbi:MAG: hypothetical protein GC155_02250 [Alphaproteobacteria bacterium]|nr:hypothetical protein [Alphaproteobacteria bacterium]